MGNWRLVWISVVIEYGNDGLNEINARNKVLIGINMANVRTASVTVEKGQYKLKVEHCFYWLV